MRNTDSSRDCPPEQRLVFLLAGGERNDASVGELLARDLDWSLLLHFAINNKAVATLSRAAARAGVPSIPAPVLTQLGKQRMVSDFHMLHLQKRAVATLEVFQRAGVRALMLKGAAMGASEYMSFAERPMADLDILIQTEDVDRAVRCVIDAGWIAEGDAERQLRYVEHHHLAPFLDGAGSGHKLELHTSPFPLPNPFGEVGADLWDKATMARPEFHGALVPCREQLLVFAAVHFAWGHMMHRGSWRTFRDIARLLDAGCDPDIVCETASRWKATSSCYWTLRLSRTLSRTSVSDSLLERLRPPLPVAAGDMLERHFVRLQCVADAADPLPLRTSDLLLRLALRPRWSGHGATIPGRDRQKWVEGVNAAPQPFHHRMRDSIGRIARSASYFASLLSPVDQLGDPLSAASARTDRASGQTH